MESPDFPPRRVVLLGASNVIRGIATVVDTARTIYGGPLDVLAAIGHGRSYGSESRVFVRRLPAILDCGLWSALHERPPAATVGLITDIGNDILYGFSAEQIAAWVRVCLERLTPACERIVLTELPLVSVRKLDRLRFVLLRSILFPKSQMQLHSILATAEELNERIIELANRFEVQLIRPESEWYGIDPIHIRLGRRANVWRRILEPWRDERDGTRVAPTDAQAVELFRDSTTIARASSVRLRLLRPLRRTWCGVEQHQAQPAARLDDGSLISLY